MKKLWHSWRDGELQMVSSSLSFTTIIALVPFVIVTLSIFQMFSGLDALYPKLETFVISIFKDPMGEAGAKFFKNALNRLQAGKLGPIGIVGLMVTSFILVRDIDRAIQRIWHLTVSRPFYKRWFWYWIVLMLTPFVLAGYVALKSIMAKQGLVPMWIISVGGFCLGWFFLSLLNKWIPAKKVFWRDAILGSFVSMVALNILYWSFKWMTTQLFYFGKLYGSLAVIPLSLVGVQLFWMTLLSGTWLIAHWREQK